MFFGALWQIRSTMAGVSRLLKRQKFSEDAIEQAGDRISDLADRLEKQLAGNRWYVRNKHDDKPIGLIAETSGDAFGEHTHASSNVKAAVIDKDNVSIAIGRATSVAVSEGGTTYTSTASFTAVTGADISVTKSFNMSGRNFQKSSEFVVAVDFKFLKDLNINLGREFNLVNRRYADIDDGNVARVSFDAYASGENTYASVVADALAVEDALSTSYASADVFIG